MKLTRKQQAIYKAPADLTLKFVRIIRTEEHVRSRQDARRFVDRYILEYRGSDGEEYRKSPETRPAAAIHIIYEGTHKELNAPSNLFQWNNK